MGGDSLETRLSYANRDIRLEDNVLVTEDGCINLTTVAKDLADVEALVCGE